jgi:hypothetical protein
MPDGDILWTHVTSPFIDTDIYNQIIKTYLRNLDQFDSLMTVTKIQKYWKIIKVTISKLTFV